MKKVLVAEDDQLLSSILLRTLQDEGFDAHAAADGFIAEVEIKSWHPDILLLDLLMPNEDGFAVLRMLHTESGNEKTRVVVLTNLSAPETREEVKKFGVDDYIVKASTTPREIVARLKELK